jgi:lipoate-protein ligase A
MALDEALLEAAGQRGVCTLRFYRWSAATVSLGYFQSVADRGCHPASRACPLVRRQTGGGAIVHDHESTYSFAAPAGSPLAVNAMSLYGAVHGALVDALASLGIHARIHDGGTGSPGDRESFLCFLRRAPGDVLLGDAKIAGSAQRRRRGALLQHGSLILRTSPAAPEVPGLWDLTDRSTGPRLSETRARVSEGLAHVTDQKSGFSEKPGFSRHATGHCRSEPSEQLRLAWQTAAADRLQLRLIEQSITADEDASAKRLVAEKYGTPDWNEKR